MKNRPESCCPHLLYMLWRETSFRAQNTCYDHQTVRGNEKNEMTLITYKVKTNKTDQLLGTYGSNSVTQGFGSYCMISAARSNSSLRTLMLYLSTTRPRSWDISNGSSMHIKWRSFPTLLVQSFSRLLNVLTRWRRFD